MRLRMAVLEAVCKGIRQFEIVNQAGIHPVVSSSSTLDDHREVKACRAAQCHRPLCRRIPGPESRIPDPGSRPGS
jgi:hypothetical protein